MKHLLKAASFAAKKHAKQRRMNLAREPYVNHPIEVAEYLADVGGITDESILTAALLHDTIEDTDATPEEIEAVFGKEVCGLVQECTDDKSLAKLERKRLQIVNAPHKSPGAKLIKLADKTCNLRGMLKDPPKNWPIARQLEYFLWAEKVVAGLKGVHPVLEDGVDQLLKDGIKKLTSRQKAEGKIQD